MVLYNCVMFTSHFDLTLKNDRKSSKIDVLAPHSADSLKSFGYTHGCNFFPLSLAQIHLFQLLGTLKNIFFPWERDSLMEFCLRKKASPFDQSLLL